MPEATAHFSSAQKQSLRRRLLSIGYLIPYAYVILAAAFRNVDPALEEASRVCGRGAWYTFSRVALPSILPAVGNWYRFRDWLDRRVA